MKYTYVYKTSDGTRHEAVMDAPSREDVFIALRKQGIKPIKVIAADGSKANGEARNKGKSWILAVAVLATGAVFHFGGRRATDAKRADAFLDGQTRRQVIGDAAVIEHGIRTGWEDIFTREGDRFLASFAIPGVKAGVRNTSVAEIEAALKRDCRDGAAGWSLEGRQIRAMVEGMKAELRTYLAAGGTVVEYGKRLTERQDAEIAVAERVRREVETAQKTLGTEALNNLVDRRNDELRGLGIRPVVLPEE